MGMLRGPLHGTGIYVDCFTKPCIAGAAYFLTHFHADHMAGLCEGWAHGLLYCSVVTARLLIEVKKVSCKVIRKQPIDRPFELVDPLTHVQVTATLVDADHCPGSVMVILEGCPEGALVHTGDFRFYEGLACNEALKRVAESRQCSRVYMDYSWAHEAFEELPVKSDSVAQLLDLIDSFPNEPIVLHSHGLGDEELLSAVAQHFPSERFLFTDARRLRELKIAAPELCCRFELFDVADARRQQKQQRFCIVKSHAQKRKFGLQGIEISCSTMWWAKVVHNQVRSVQHPVKDSHTGAWHVLWAMHSSLAELRRFVSWLQPQALEGICPVICHEDSPTCPLSRFHDLLASGRQQQAKRSKLSSSTAKSGEKITAASSSPESGQSDMLRSKVLASTAAYRAELCLKVHGGALASVASAGMKPTRKRSRSMKSPMDENDTLCRLLGQQESQMCCSPQQRLLQVASRSCVPGVLGISPIASRDLLLSEEASVGGQKVEVIHDSPLPRLARHIPSTPGESATLLRAQVPRRWSSASRALSPGCRACPSTQREDSCHSVEVLDVPEDSCPDTCPDTEVEEDSCELNGEVIPLNLAAARLPQSSALSPSRSADLLSSVPDPAGGRPASATARSNTEHTPALCAERPLLHRAPTSALLSAGDRVCWAIASRATGGHRSSSPISLAESSPNLDDVDMYAATLQDT